METNNFWTRFFAAISSVASIPAFLILLYYANLPDLIDYTSRFQELTDLLQAAAKPEYLQNTVEIFDYIIIGAGSAGAVVANRLSADGQRSVLVLEGGGDPSPFTRVPALFPYTIQQPSTDYGYKSVQQKEACLASELQCVFARGKGLGGTSNINAMNYLRGSSKDFDEWATASGDSIWSYDSVKKMFKKSESYYGHYKPLNMTFHSRNGELYVGEQATDTALNYLFQAFQEKNFPNVDMNTDLQQGYGYLDQNIKSGRRYGTYKAFIQPALNRMNLSVYRYARALKIHFTENLRAFGVTYLRHGTKRFVRARKEILLCAGTIDSPRLLMLSGIGPKEHLESIGINPVLVDLPVGQGLEDHIGVGLTVSINESLAYLPERDMTFSDISNYLQYGQGPLAKVGFNSLGIAYATTSVTNNTKWPDLQFLLSGRASKDAEGQYQDYLSILVMLMRPKSHGNIKLLSRDPDDRPIIDPMYLTHPGDISRILEGIQIMLELFDTEALKSLQPQLSPNTQIPGCESIPFKTQEYWKCYIRHKSSSRCHPTGTCRMGKAKNDLNAVVDSRLRVLKTKGLRVIDCSIIPSIPSGHMNAVAVMIGEMGSMFVLQDN